MVDCKSVSWMHGVCNGMKKQAENLLTHTHWNYVKRLAFLVDCKSLSWVLGVCKDVKNMQNTSLKHETCAWTPNRVF